MDGWVYCDVLQLEAWFLFPVVVLTLKCCSIGIFAMENSSLFPHGEAASTVTQHGN